LESKFLNELESEKNHHPVKVKEFTHKERIRKHSYIDRHFSTILEEDSHSENERKKEEHHEIAKSNSTSHSKEGSQ